MKAYFFLQWYWIALGAAVIVLDRIAHSKQVRPVVIFLLFAALFTRSSHSKNEQDVWLSVVLLYTWPCVIVLRAALSQLTGLWEKVESAFGSMPLVRTYLTERRGRSARKRAEEQVTCKHQWKHRRQSAPTEYRVWCARCGKEDYQAARRLLEQERMACFHAWEKSSYSSDTEGSFHGKQCRKCGKLVGGGTDPFGVTWKS